MNKFPGGHRGRVTPVPIPNTEVKPATADGTACVGVWESRSLPGVVYRSPLHLERAFSFSPLLFLGTAPLLGISFCCTVFCRMYDAVKTGPLFLGAITALKLGLSLSI